VAEGSRLLLELAVGAHSSVYDCLSPSGYTPLGKSFDIGTVGGLVCCSASFPAPASAYYRHRTAAGCVARRVVLRQSTSFTFALLLPGGAVRSRAPRGMPVPGRVPISASVALRRASGRRALLACNASYFVKAALKALGGLVNAPA